MKQLLLEWCNNNSKKESHSENEVYIGNFEVDDSNNSSINVFLTSESLLHSEAASQKHLYIEKDFVPLSNSKDFL